MTTERNDSKMLKDLIELIKRTLSDEDITIEKFSESVGVSSGTIYRMMNDEGAEFRLSTVEKLTRRCGANLLIASPNSQQIDESPTLMKIDQLIKSKKSAILLLSALLGAVAGYLLSRKH